MKRIMRYAAVIAAAAVVAASVPAAAAAEPPPGGSFGQHVSSCARTMGLDGEHNPGMHRGLSGWHSMPCVPDA